MGPVNVAGDLTRIIGLTSNYIYKTMLTREGVIVKVGDTVKMKAGVVNVTSHRGENNNKLQDKILAVKLAYRMHKYLKSNRGDQ